MRYRKTRLCLSLLIIISIAAAIIIPLYATYTDKVVVMGMLSLAEEHKSQILDKKFPYNDNDGKNIVEEYVFIDNGIIMVNNRVKAMLVIVFYDSDESIFRDNNKGHFCYGKPYEPIANRCPVRINTSPLH